MSSKTQRGASESAGAFVPQVQTGTVSTDSRLPLQPDEPLLFFCSESEFQVVGGKLLPLVSEVRIKPGALCVDRRGGVSGLIGVMTLSRKILVPPDREVPAWGERCRGYNRQLDIRVKDARGNQEFAYCSIWQRPRLVGGVIVWDRDADGYVAFLEEVYKDLLGGRIDPAIREATEAPLRHDLATYRRRPSHDVWAQDQIALLYTIYPSLRPKTE